MRILGIETSCDETGVAIYDSDAGLLADALYSQVEVHADYGGECFLYCTGGEVVGRTFAG